jgi:cation:H+ antiporter
MLEPPAALGCTSSVITDVLVLLASGVALYFGAEWLVGGASALALALRVPQLIVGLTVVAYGTSAPEIIVGIEAAVSGHGDVAVGNVLGSNIANLGLILGVALLVQPARVDGSLRRRELPVLLATALGLPLILLDGTVTRLEGAFLATGSVVLTAALVHAARRPDLALATEQARITAEAADQAGAPAEATTPRRAVAVALSGLVVLLVGGHYFVESATDVAVNLGMSERLVGLTIVAVGTSLPELATSVIAARRGHGDIAIGNVIGSNVFNVLLCLGGAAVAAPITGISGSFVRDAGIALAMTLLAVVFLRTERTFSRVEAGCMLATYLAFLVWAISS